MSDNEQHPMDDDNLMLDDVNGDFISDGFHKIDDRFVSNNPPKIKWGKQFLVEMSVDTKLSYLKKLAATMNHAAKLVQDERNELGRLCELKEQQLIKLNKSVEANNMMLQTEVTKMNEQRQGFNAEVIRLNKRIRELEY